MTVVTFHGLVFSHERITTAGMIEFGLLETIDHVASGTVIRKLTHMGIPKVAGIAALEGNGGELLVLMTSSTLDGSMHPAQRIARLFMIERTGLPVIRGVASLTVVA